MDPICMAVLENGRDAVSQEKLETLNESARSLIAAEDRDAIAHIAIDIVENAPEFDIGCVRLFDVFLILGD